MICECEKHTSLFVPPRIFLPVERERVQAIGGLVGCGAGAAVLPLFFWFLFFFPFSLVACCALCLFFFSVSSSITYLFALCSPYREGVQGGFVFLR